jgi:hypothetical protein
MDAFSMGVYTAVMSYRGFTSIAPAADDLEEPEEETRRVVDESRGGSRVYLF